MLCEDRADNRMQARLGEPVAGGFRLPDVEVAQMAILHHLGDMDDQPSGG